MDRADIYSEKLMNIILDAIDDIIIICDSAHTVIWINRAGEKAFGVTGERVIGMKCYELFGNTTSCSDCCAEIMMNKGAPTNVNKRRVIPKTGIFCDCASLPYFEKGRLELVVQHLRPVPKND